MLAQVRQCECMLGMEEVAPSAGSSYPVGNDLQLTQGGECAFCGSFRVKRVWVADTRGGSLTFHMLIPVFVWLRYKLDQGADLVENYTLLVPSGTWTSIMCICTVSCTEGGMGW